MDDIIATGNNSKEIELLISQLNRIFPLKDLGRFNYLGLEATYLPHGDMMHSQAIYTRELLLKAEMHNSKPLPTPMATDVKLFSNDSEPFKNPTQYSSTLLHWKSVKRILRYLQDADWGGNLEDRKSISGFCVYLGNNLISWKNNKQTKVSRSSMEAKYKAMFAAQTEIMSLQQLLQELRIPQTVVPTIYCDNQSACLLVANPILYNRSVFRQLATLAAVLSAFSSGSSVCFRLRFLPTVPFALPSGSSVCASFR
ncbi:uncharacterized protein LOC107615196 [Arachis ipaensis]|uniref:uncharacterized protein LOC107615196 n=1 Tax=Arachis ipaensis TaxID=130454 RepID=UPI0007AF285C|nr:uncharacterized protein LOC107615196 [Arachis ipaensis]